MIPQTEIHIEDCHVYMINRPRRKF